MALLNEAIAPGVLTHIADHDVISRVVNERHGVNVVNPVAGQHYAPDMALGETHVVNLPAAGVVTLDAPVSTDAERAWLPGAELVVVLVSPVGSTATVAWAAAYAAGGAPLPQAGTTVVGRWRNITVDASPAVWVPAAAPSGAFSGHMRATSQGTADVASVVKGFAGQSADLEQWQNSAGVVLSRVDSAGAIWEGANHVYSAGNPNLASSVAAASAFGSASLVGTGTAYARNDHFHGTPALPFASTVASSTAFGQAAAVGTGTALARNDHVHGTPPTPATSVAGRTGAVVLTAADVGAGSFPGAVTFASTSTFTGAATFNGTAAFNGTVAFNAAVTTGSITETGQTLSQPSIASQVPQIIKGFASQSVDLTQWQNSAAAVLARVNSAGSIATAGTLTVGLSGATVQGGAGAQINPYAANVTGLVVQGFASQTSDLTQWQDSTGAVKARVNPGGTFQNGFAVINGGATTPQTYLTNGNNGGNSVLGVQSQSASQTADLTYWQNNGGASVARVLPNGAGVFGANGQTIPTAPRLTVLGTGAAPVGGPSSTEIIRMWAANTNVAIGMGALGAAPWNTWIQAFDTTTAGSYYPLNLQPLGGNTLVGGTGSTAGDVKLTVQAATAQSGDLQQWWNSAGQFVAGVSASGRIYSSGFTPNTSPLARIDASGAFGPPDSTGVPLAVLASAGNAADLFDALNTGTGVIARITSGGNVQGTGAYTTLSDAAAKTNVRGLVHDPLDVVRRLRPRHFDYIAGDFGGERDQVGFIAQELQAVLPQAVVPFGDEHLGTRSEAIVAYLVAAVQELDRRTAA